MDYEKALYLLLKEIEELKAKLHRHGMGKLSPDDHCFDQSYSGFGRVSPRYVREILPQCTEIGANGQA